MDCLAIHSTEVAAGLVPDAGSIFFHADIIANISTNTLEPKSIVADATQNLNHEQLIAAKQPVAELCKTIAHDFSPAILQVQNSTNCLIDSQDIISARLSRPESLVRN